VIMVVLFALWAWVISSIYDKDAGQWYLKRRMWNGIHVAVGLLCLGLVVALPLPFFITGPALAVILIADLLAYFFIRNADEKVAASAKWSLNPSKIMEARGGGKGKKDEIKKTTSLVFKGPQGVLAAPVKETPEFEIRIAAETLINRLVELHGTQVDAAPI